MCLVSKGITQVFKNPSHFLIVIFFEDLRSHHLYVFISAIIITQHTAYLLIFHYYFQALVFYDI